jgi:hypothetical protein
MGSLGTDTSLPSITGGLEYPALAAPMSDVWPQGAETELTRRVKAVKEETAIREAEYAKQVAAADGVGAKIAQIDIQRAQFTRKQAGEEASIREEYAKKAEQYGLDELADKFRLGNQLQVETVRQEAATIEAQNRARRQGYEVTYAEQEGRLANVRRTHQLSDERANAQFARSRTVDYGEGAGGAFRRAEAEYAAYAKANQEKIASLSSFQAQTDQIYNTIAAAAEATYGRDEQHYIKAIADKEAADIHFQTEQMRLQNETDSHLQAVIDAHKRAAEAATQPWSEAFNQMGSEIESTIGTAIKAAFMPMKPEYWYSSVQGPHGQPLTQAHRISPVGQELGGLGMSLLGDVGKAFQSTLMSSLAKSIFPGSSSFGEGLAKMIGVGTPGGLFGTGLGAVQGVDQAATAATFASSTAVFASAVGTFAAAAGTSAAGGGLGSLGTAASAGGLLSKIPFIGSLFGGGGAALGGGESAALLSVLSSGGIIPSFASGGLVYSAQAGWSVGSHGGGGVPALLHSKEMVLPAHISEGLQEMISSGGGGGAHLHFHGPADAPSMQRWFRNFMQSNPDAIRQMFRQNSLTPRSL